MLADFKGKEVLWLIRVSRTMAVIRVSRTMAVIRVSRTMAVIRVRLLGRMIMCTC